MQDLFNALLRAYVKVALNVYFNRIRVHGTAHIPKNKAVLLVANHQNALIDPILLATHTRLNPYFLTRASVFQKSFVAKILHFIRMIPVYRVRDGLRNMEKNQESFEQSVDILRRNGCMIIFGEGNHASTRSLRPLKKGFVRIAFQALAEDPELDLVILPVGINYTNHQASGSEVGIYFGEALPAQPYLGKPLHLLRAVEAALQPLVSQIPEEEHAELTQALIKRKVKLSDPEAVRKGLPRLEFDCEGSLATLPGNSGPSLLKRLNRWAHFPAYLFWRWAAPKISDPAFIATFKFCIGLVLVPLQHALLWYLAFQGQYWAASYAVIGTCLLLVQRAEPK